jgi:regulator of RNase E activity RraA
MRTGKDRVQVDAVQVPVNIGDARVLPGDLLRGDADGVVVIPRSREEEVLDIAEHIEASEQQIRNLVESGLSLREAREKLQYHTLQSK